MQKLKFIKLLWVVLALNILLLGLLAGTESLHKSLSMEFQNKVDAFARSHDISYEQALPQVPIPAFLNIIRFVHDKISFWIFLLLSSAIAPLTGLSVWERNKTKTLAGILTMVISALGIWYTSLYLLAKVLGTGGLEGGAVFFSIAIIHGLVSFFLIALSIGYMLYTKHKTG